MLQYTQAVKKIVDEMAIDIEEFVNENVAINQKRQLAPLALIISLLLFVPVIIYVTLNANFSIFRYVLKH